MTTAASGSIAHAYCHYVGSAVHALPAHTVPDHETVHAIRKDLKRARAALQLLRPRLPPMDYELQKHCIKDLAHALAGARDAKVAADTLDQVLVPAKSKDTGHVHNLRRRLHDERDLRASTDLTSPRRRLLRASKRIARADLRVSASILSSEMRKSYRRTRRAMESARKRPTAARLHRLRRRVTRLKHQLEMLRIAPRLQRRLQRISDLLGADHDLWLLRQAMRTGDSPGRKDTKSADYRRLAQSIRRRRKDIQKRALRLSATTFEASNRIDRPVQRLTRSAGHHP